MSREDALTVVTGAGGDLVEPPVAERIVRFVSGAERAESGALGRLEVEPALLSVVCHELNRRRRQRGEKQITADLLEGDRTAILAEFYERGVADVPPAVRCFVEERLLTASGFRDSVALESALGVPGVEREAVDRLVARRLLRIEERGGVARLELTHDVLTGVVQASRDARREHEARDAAEAARREAEERERVAHAKLRRSRIASAVLAALFLVTALLGVMVYRTQREAEAARINTSYQTARSLADQGPDKAADSLAYVASILRLDPQHTPARYLLDGLLLQRAWVLPRLVLPQGEALLGALSSDDGRVILTITRSGIGQVWDGRTGRRRGDPLRHEGRIVSAALSPAGNLAVTAGLEGGARLWDTATGRPVGEAMRHADLITSLRFTPDGRRVVTTSRDRTARLWDAATGLPIGEPMRHQDRVSMVAVSRDGARLATASDDGEVMLWDAAGRPVLPEPMRHERDFLWDLDLSPDGSMLLSINASYVRLWEGRAGQYSETTLGLPAWVVTGRFSPDGRLIAFGSPTGFAYLWNVEEKKLAVPELEHGGAVTSVSFSPDGRRLVAVSADDSARVWDVGTGAVLANPLRHGAAVASAAFSGPRGLQVVTGSADGTARVWDLRTARGGGYPLFREPGGGLTFLDATGRNAVVHVEREGIVGIRVYEVATGSPLGPFIPLPSWPFLTRLSPGGGRALLVLDGVGQLRDTGTGAEIAELRHRADSPIVDARLGAGGRLVVTLSKAGGVRVWEVATGRPVGPELPRDSARASRIFAADLDASGGQLATAHDDGQVRLWKLPGVQLAGKPLQYDLPVTWVRFLSDAYLLAASPRGELWLRDLATGKLVGEVMRHDLSVLDAEPSVDGRRLVTASLDGAARVWSLPEGKLVGAPIRTGSSVERARFSPDRRSLLTLNALGWAGRWDVETGAPLGPARAHGSAYSRAFDSDLGFKPSDARFLGDGVKWVTAGHDGTAIVWESLLGAKDGPESLADLAEAVSGFEVDAGGSLQPIRDPAARLRKLRNRAGRENLPFIRWFLSDPWQRTITPLSKLTAKQYLRRRLEAMEEALGDLPPGAREIFERQVGSELQISFPGHPMLQGRVTRLVESPH